MRRRLRLTGLLFLFCLVFLKITTVSAANARLSVRSVTLQANSAYVLTLKNAKNAARWKSSDSSVVSIVYKNGRKAVLKAKKPGSAKISVKSGKKKLSCRIKVKKWDGFSKKLTVLKGDTVSFRKNNKKGSWKSSDSSVARVSGKAKARKIRFRNTGTVTITEKIGSKIYRCKVQVLTKKGEKKASSQKTEKKASSQKAEKEKTETGTAPDSKNAPDSKKSSDSEKSSDSKKSSDSENASDIKKSSDSEKAADSENSPDSRKSPDSKNTSDGETISDNKTVSENKTAADRTKDPEKADKNTDPADQEPAHGENERAGTDQKTEIQGGQDTEQGGTGNQSETAAPGSGDGTASQRRKDYVVLEASFAEEQLIVGQEYQISLKNAHGKVSYQVQGDHVSVSGDGKVKALKPGTAIIYVSTDGDDEAYSQRETLVIPVAGGNGPRYHYEIFVLNEHPIYTKGADAILYIRTDNPNPETVLLRGNDKYIAAASRFDDVKYTGNNSDYYLSSVDGGYITRRGAEEAGTTVEEVWELYDEDYTDSYYKSSERDASLYAAKTGASVSFQSLDYDEAYEKAIQEMIAKYTSPNQTLYEKINSVAIGMQGDFNYMSSTYGYESDWRYISTIPLFGAWFDVKELDSATSPPILMKIASRLGVTSMEHLTGDMHAYVKMEIDGEEYTFTGCPWMGDSKYRFDPNNIQMYDFQKF